MNAAEMKLKDVEAALFSGVPSDDFVAACEADARAGVQRLAKRYRREQAERAVGYIGDNCRLIESETNDHVIHTVHSQFYIDAVNSMRR